MPLPSAHQPKLLRGGWDRFNVLRAWLTLSLLSLGSGTAYAQLRWENLRSETTATAGDPPVVVEFPFINAGDEPIRILRVVSSCDCTTAKASADTIAPNQTGSVRAEFTLANRVGRQEKTITVATSDAPTAPTILTLHVTISEVVASTPRVLMWKIEEPATEKILELNAVPPHRIGMVDPPASPPGFECRLEWREGMQRFLLHVTPTSTRTPATAVIPLTVKVEGRPAVSHAVYAVVK